MFLSVIDDLGERCLLRLVHSKELLEPALHHLTVAADKKPSRIDGAIRPPMFTKCLCSEIARIRSNRFPFGSPGSNGRNIAV